MKKCIKNFLQNDCGAVTVDWVVLTALVIGLITVAFSGVEGGVSALTAKLLAYLQSFNVGA